MANLPSQEQPVILAEHIQMAFFDPSPLTILSDINLTVYPKQSVAIVGKSGEGKTTLLHILGTIEEASAGNLFIAGNKVTASLQNTLRNKHIGFIFQAFHLLENATVLENVLMPLKIARKNVSLSSPYYKRAIELIDRVGLTKRLHFPTSKLSGGEKQRVAIARAFAHDPDIILADEPTGNLDHNTAQDIQSLLLDFVKKEGKALLIVTHNLQLAKLCNACYELESGYLRPI